MCCYQNFELAIISVLFNVLLELLKYQLSSYSQQKHISIGTMTSYNISGTIGDSNTIGSSSSTIGDGSTINGGINTIGSSSSSTNGNGNTIDSGNGGSISLENVERKHIMSNINTHDYFKTAREKDPTKFKKNSGRRCMHNYDVNKQYDCKVPAYFSCDTCSTKWHETNVCTLCASNSITKPISDLAEICESDSYHARTCSKLMDHLQFLAFNKSKKVVNSVDDPISDLTKTCESDSYDVKTCSKSVDHLQLLAFNNSDSSDSTDSNDPFYLPYIKDAKTGTNLTKAIGSSSSHTSKLVKLTHRPHVPVTSPGTKQTSPSNDIILISNKKRPREQISGQADSPSDSSIKSDEVLNAILNMSWTPSPQNEASN